MRWRQLKHFCEGPPQYGLNSSTDSYVDDGVRLVRTTDIQGDGNLRSASDGVFIAPEQVESHYELRQGDLLFSRAGSLGRCFRVGKLTEPMTFAGYLVRFRPLPETEPRYLEYCAATNFFQAHIESDAITSTISNFNAERYANLRLPDIPGSAQRALADFLDTETARLDALITKKRRMIELLDERLTAAVDQQLAAGDGVPLKRLVRYQEGPGIMASDFCDAGVPLIRVAGIGGEYVTLKGCNYLEPDLVSERWGHFALDPGDYLISASASMGIVSKVGPEASGAIPYTGLIRFKPAVDDVDMEYVRYFLGSADFMRQIDQMKTGTAIQHYGPSHLDQVTIPSRPLVEQQAAVSAVEEVEVGSFGARTLLTRQIDLLPGLCRALGLAYLFDDGRYEYAGSEEMWSPGMGGTTGAGPPGQRGGRPVGRRL